MVLVAEKSEHVVGVDTHARTHTYCVIHSRTGAVVDTGAFPTSSADHLRALDWIVRRSGGTTVLAAVEETSSYGASITALLVETGIDVTEVRPAPRSSHAHAGKYDPLDAEAAARSVLGKDITKLAQPRQAGDRTALRVLLTARSLIDQQRTANRNALNALLRSVDLGIDARKPLTDTQITVIAAWRTSRDRGVICVTRSEAKRLTMAVLDQTEQLEGNHRQLAALTEQLAPGLQELPGVGPVTGSILVTVYSHHGRVRSEAAFATLGGIAPLATSSGNNSRHRLSRSGDRQLNRAIDVIVRTRMSSDTRTREYVARRRAEGRTGCKVRLCLKRYVVRSLFREPQARVT